MPSKFGRQPAYAAIYRRGLTVKSAAEAVGAGHKHLLGAVNGHVAPSENVRRELPKLLDADLSDLFSPKSLAATYSGARGPKPGWKDALLAEGSR